MNLYPSILAKKCEISLYETYDALIMLAKKTRIIVFAIKTIFAFFPSLNWQKMLVFLRKKLHKVKQTCYTLLSNKVCNICITGAKL